MIISISLFAYFIFFVDWYSTERVCLAPESWSDYLLASVLRCPRRISAEKMCTRRKEMKDVLMWSRRSFSAAFPPLPSRFRTFLHIYFLFFFDGNNLPFVTILRSPLFMRILAQSEQAQNEKKKSFHLVVRRRRRRLPPHFLHISLYLFIFATSTQLTISIHSMVHL